MTNFNERPSDFPPNSEVRPSEPRRDVQKAKRLPTALSKERESTKDNVSVILRDVNAKTMTPLKRYHSQYAYMLNRSKENPELKASLEKYSFTHVENILTANNNHYLLLVSALNENGVLFWIEADGTLLFSDAGKDPVKMGISYQQAYEEIYYKTEDGLKVKTGYEMFPVSVESQEYLKLQAGSGLPIVNNNLGCWAIDLDYSNQPACLVWNPYAKRVSAASLDESKQSTTASYKNIGFRRLVRAKDIKLSV